MDRVQENRGFTLIEILIVMAIISVLMGFGIGLYQRMTALGKATQARNTVLEELRKVKNSSLRFGRAELVVDPVQNIVYGNWLQTVASCNFEPPVDDVDLDATYLVGLLGKNGTIRGDGHPEPFPTGHTGGGLVATTGCVVSFGNYPDYDLREGVRIDVWVYPTDNEDMTLVQKGRSYGIRLVKATGGPRVQAFLGLAKSPVERPDVRRFDVDFTLAMNRWNRVILNYDRNKVTVEIDTWGRGAVLRLSEEEKRPIALDLDADLTVGGDDGMFIGRMDDLKVAGILSGEPLPMPDEVAIAGEKVRKIHYRDGKLDPEYHRGAETIDLMYKGVANPIVIGMSGNVQQK